MCRVLYADGYGSVNSICEWLNGDDFYAEDAYDGRFSCDRPQ